VPESIELALLGRYIRARRESSSKFDVAHFAELYAVTSAQRNTRLLGTFARLNKRDGKPHYLKHQPRIWRYLVRSLAHPTLAPLRRWFEDHVPPPAGV
jgi:aminoglycoside/choline kinase family phosphotransferase